MTSTKKIARVAVTMPRFSRYGGAESFAWRLSEALVAKGYEVDFICARCETEPPDGVRPVIVGRFGGLRFIKVLWFAIASEFVRRRGDYDLVFGMGKTFNQDILRIGGGPQSVFWKLSKRAWPKGFARAFKMLRRRCSPVNWVIHVLDAVRMRRTRHIVAVSHLVRRWIVEAHPHLKEDDIQVVYNRPELKRFSPLSRDERAELRREEGIAPDQVVIATAATNFVLKGIRPLLYAMARLPENYVFRVAGGRKADKYKRLARELGIEKRVHFLGKVDDMPRFYRAADIFILATFYDACSNAVLEALASGCKVLSSAWNGSAYFLEDDQIVADPGDVDELVRALTETSLKEYPGPFAWPESEESGIEPYVEMVGRLIKEKLNK